MGKIDFNVQRIDRENGDIVYEIHSVTEDCLPEEESFIRFEWFNAKRDVEIFIRGLTVPATA